MGSVRIELNDAGIREFLNSSAMQSEVLEQAKMAAGRAKTGGGHDHGDYAVDVRPGKIRAHARVSTVNDEQVRSNWKHNQLVKSVGGSG